MEYLNSGIFMVLLFFCIKDFVFSTIFSTFA
ncbi:unknown [Bacteroides sp. CAG:633]|nr:unknown [Bacteroides sp. CAG:633]